MVAISCNPTGGARLKHHRAGDYAGHLCLSVVDWRVSVPHQRAADMVARLGTPAVGIAPEAVAARQTWATDAFLDLAAREGVPDVSILWFEEPDESYHDYGIGTPTNLELMRHVDTELGRLVEWWKRQPDAERINLMVLSDHAHITQIGRLSVADILGEQGLRVGRHLEDDADLALETGYCGHLRVREGDKRTLDKAAAVLMAHPGTGMLFSRGRNEVEGICPGTLARSLVFTEHPFAPDLYFVLANDDATDANGFTGTCRYDNDLIPGAGIHGGLHPKELNNLLVASGACIAEGVRVQTPSGIYDIAPTLLHAMGLPVPQTMHGRVLTAGLAAGDDEPGEVVPEVFETGSGGFTQRLRRSRIGYSLYLEGGRRV